ncbi:hypothetical protein ACIBSW_17390 [Actinoplanes sp. NPDC049668]|uniref:hypothetical protein n=1 Tax=unclassified Actinoplanes TaxID=2626549 RepID=UPI0033BBF4DA
MGEVTVAAPAWWGRGRIWGVVLLVCLAAVVAGAVVTAGFEQDVQAAVSYRDLVDVVLRSHHRLIFWSRVSWAAVAIAALLVAVWSVVRWRRGLPHVPRMPAAVATLLLVACVVHTGLTWYLRAGQGGSSGELVMVSGATPIGDQAREATLATSPLFPAYGWFGVVVVALATAFAAAAVLSRRGDRDP